MGNLAMSNKILDKYFSFLINLDDVSKKSLINKLINSLESKSERKFDIKSIYGAWEDNRTSDEIISEIKSSRIEKSNTAHL